MDKLYKVEIVGEHTYITEWKGNMEDYRRHSRGKNEFFFRGVVDTARGYLNLRGQVNHIDYLEETVTFWDGEVMIRNVGREYYFTTEEDLKDIYGWSNGAGFITPCEKEGKKRGWWKKQLSEKWTVLFNGGYVRKQSTPCNYSTSSFTLER